LPRQAEIAAYGPWVNSWSCCGVSLKTAFGVPAAAQISGKF